MRPCHQNNIQKSAQHPLKKGELESCYTSCSLRAQYQTQQDSYASNHAKTVEVLDADRRECDKAPFNCDKLFEMR